MRPTTEMMTPNTQALIMEVTTSQVDTARAAESRITFAGTPYTVCASVTLAAMPGHQEIGRVAAGSGDAECRVPAGRPQDTGVSAMQYQWDNMKKMQAKKQISVTMRRDLAAPMVKHSTLRKGPAIMQAATRGVTR
jgi:hypothetical protein